MERNIYGSGPSLVKGDFFLDDLLCPEDEVTVQEQARGESGATSPTKSSHSFCGANPLISTFVFRNHLVSVNNNAWHGISLAGSNDRFRFRKQHQPQLLS